MLVEVEKHMIISKGTDKVIDKIQFPFMIKKKKNKPCYLNI